MNTIKWIPLTRAEQVEEIKERSKTVPQVIFKHSIRCGTSALAKGRLERSSNTTNAEFYYLDLVNYREISNQVTVEFMVEHESPQILLIKNGECVFDESHVGIRMEEILEKVG